MTDPRTIDTYRSVADEYRDRHEDRATVADQVERFLAAVEDRTGESTARLADVGCGPGWETEAFVTRGHDAVALDLTPAFLEMVRETAPGAAVARMDMRRLGFGSRTFDGLWACASFLHVPREDAPATLSEFQRVLRSGGVLHLSVKRGDGEREGDGYDDDRRRFTLYQPADLEEMVTAAGFDVEFTTADEWIQLLARA